MKVSLLDLTKPVKIFKDNEEFRRSAPFLAEVIRITIDSFARDDEQSVASKKLMQYLLAQFNKFGKFLDEDVDLLAVLVRNILELSLWCKYIKIDSNGANVLLHEYVTDIWELVKVAKVDDEPRMKAIVSPFGNVEEYFRAIQEIKSLPSKHTSMQRDELSQNLTFKYCSKLVHPTSFSVVQIPSDSPEAIEKIRDFLRSMCWHNTIVAITNLVDVQIEGDPS
jgi:hypothetical protein